MLQMKAYNIFRNLIQFILNNFRLFTSWNNEPVIYEYNRVSVVKTIAYFRKNNIPESLIVSIKNKIPYFLETVLN